MLKIYSIEETCDKKCNRIIVFNLLRSIIYVKIKDNKIHIIQQVRCDEFYNETITNVEQERLLWEKSKIDWLVRKHYDELVKNEPVAKIISCYTEPENYGDTLLVDSEKTPILKVEYIHDMLVKEYREHREYHAKMFEKYHSNYDKCEMNKYPNGIQTVRFYLYNNNKVDVSFSSSHVCHISCSPYVTHVETNEIEYFCNKYFLKFISGIDINQIINEAEENSLNMVNSGIHYQKNKEIIDA